MIYYLKCLRFDGNGICAALISAAKKTKLDDETEAIIAQLPQNQPELVKCNFLLGGIDHENSHFLEHYVETLDDNQLFLVLSLKAIHVLRKHPNRAFSLKSDVKRTPYSVTVYDTDTVLDSAFRAKRYNALSILARSIRKRQNPNLAEMLASFMNKYPPDHIRSCYLKNLGNKYGFLSQASYKSTYGHSEDPLRAPNFRFSTSTTKSDLVARFPSRTKVMRQECKRALDQFLHFAEWKPIDTSNQDLSATYVMRFQCGRERYALTRKEKPLSLIITKNDSEFIILNWDERRIFNTELLTNIFRGDRLEIVDNHKYDKVKDDFWDNWKDIPSYDEYEKVYDPVFMQVVDTIIKQKSLENPHILEICGGAGRLAEKILTKTACTYFLLEKNEKSLEEARSKVNNKAKILKTDIVNDGFPLPENSIDIVIGCGALTAVVLENKAEALKALKNVHFSLKSSGFLVLAGHGSSLLHSEDFTAQGFKVINTSLPGHNRSLYIVQKE